MKQTLINMLTAKNLKRVPFVLCATIVWMLFKLTGANLALSGWAGTVIVLLTFVTIVMEFYKSGDIGLKTFIWDTSCAVAQVVLVTICMTVVVTRNLGVAFSDFFVCGAVLVDALVSPINSFRTALRNWSSGQAASPSES